MGVRTAALMDACLKTRKVRSMEATGMGTVGRGGEKRGERRRGQIHWRNTVMALEVIGIL